HCRSLGGRRFTPVCSRDRLAHLGTFFRNRGWHRSSLWARSHVQSDFCRRKMPRMWMALTLALRHQSRTNRFDDRKLSHRFLMEPDAPMLLRDRWPAPRGFRRRLALNERRLTLLNLVQLVMLAGAL